MLLATYCRETFSDQASRNSAYPIGATELDFEETREKMDAPYSPALASVRVRFRCVSMIVTVSPDIASPL
jgi:hypothetical protein